MNNLENFIKESVGKGLKIKDIKESLLSSGHSETDISSAIKKLYREQVINLAKYINKELKLGLSPSAVKNSLVAMGHPREQVDEAVEKVISAKKYLLRKKRIEKTKEQFKEINRNVKSNISGLFSRYFSWIPDIWSKLKPWQRGAYIPAAVLFIILIFWEIIMMINSIILSGKLNCYSFGRVISCSFFESLIFYVLLMLAFTVIFVLPVSGIGALIGYLIGRYKE